MKRIVAYMFILCFTISCHAQIRKQSEEQHCNRLFDSSLKRWVYLATTKEAEFPGGNSKRSLFIAKNVKYSNQEYFKGSVMVSFIVEKDGAITNARIQSNDSLTEIDKEVLRVIGLMPNWNPAECSGKKVPVRVTLPVNF